METTSNREGEQSVPLSADQAPAISDAAVRVRALMLRIAEELGVETSVEVHEDDQGVSAQFIGAELGSLIGARGRTIDAIQHLAYRTAHRATEARGRVIVDAAGYRERRAVALRAAGDQAAERATSDHRSIELEAMSALERKIVHEHLKSRRDVETYSQGEEPDRRLVVAPLVA